ncbi:hypothetical protein SM120_02925 [Lactococcus lactis subsp. lactis]|uniref:hypothetical protein n=1 Tax=Lactococcus lactis TaxID=1358 RepID=UPI002A80F0BD|nr:hypothetical protein [Lactococcus lactis]MDY4362598.1 hypothetical protein [Lactococcus lactis subsp. lactis]
MKKFKTKFITLALASAFIAVGYSTAASADSVKSTTPNSTPTISLRSNVEFQGGGGSKQFTYIKHYANGYLAYDNWFKRYVYVVTRNPAGAAFYVVSKNFVYSV